MRQLARYEIGTKHLELLLETGETCDVAPVQGVVPFVGCPADEVAGAQWGARDSSAHLWLPSLGLDSKEVYEVVVVFLIGPPPVVIIATTEDLPHDLMAWLVRDIARDLGELGPDRWINLARELKWVLIQVLRGRVRAIEQSVRDALSDDFVSAGDYAALREYADRLAIVERLWSATTNPTWESHRRRDPYASLYDVETPAMGNVGNEAREAVARLSGLIASQQIVLTQRQSAETERFQRVVTRVGAVVLVPGLVAALFSANVGFAGKGTSRDFWAVILFMFGSGVGSYTILRAHELGLWKDAGRIGSLLGLSKLTPNARVALAAVVCIIAIVAGAFEIGGAGAHRSTIKARHAGVTRRSAQASGQTTLGPNARSTLSKVTTGQVRSPFAGMAAS